MWLKQHTTATRKKVFLKFKNVNSHTLPPLYLQKTGFFPWVYTHTHTHTHTRDVTGGLFMPTVGLVTCSQADKWFGLKTISHFARERIYKAMGV